MSQESVNIKEINEKIQKESSFVDLINIEMRKVIIGQQHLIDGLLIGLLSDGHILLEGVPGLAKTLAINTLSSIIDAKYSRIQFTPDLLPADLIGTMIYSQKKEEFQVKQGPIFTNFVLADEINRSPAKVQSALLEAMQEKQVTIGSETFMLPKPFLVMATQNPIEQEGTYPLPEAQLDRFLLQIDVDYPDRDAERDILLATTGVEDAEVSAVFDAAGLITAQTAVRRMPIGESIVELILDLVRAARPGEGASDLVNTSVSWGPGPRAAQALSLAVRARALMDGRFAPNADDIAALAHPVLKHRMALGFAARAEGLTVDKLISTLVDQVLGEGSSA